MSTLTVTNIKATGETASRAVSGVAAAYVSFEQIGTVSIYGSQNVSSVTDNGTGFPKPSYTSNLNNTNYTYSIIASDTNATISFIERSNVLVGSLQFFYGIVSNTSGGLSGVDCNSVNAIVYGDLA